MTKRPDLLDLVALKIDLPEFRLKSGDIGTVVEVYPAEAVEVEFLDKEGDTVALLTVSDKDLRFPSSAEVEEGGWPAPLPQGIDVPWGDATHSTRRQGAESRDDDE